MDPVWLNTLNITGDEANTNASQLQSMNQSHRVYMDPSVNSLETLDATSRTLIMLLYTSTGIAAFIGNLIVILVESFGRRSAANLRKFLISLAISDILFGVFSVPFTYTDFMFGRWIFWPWLCPWAQFIQILSIFITSYTLTLISIERYYAIVFPLSNQNKWLATKTHYALLVGWILGVLWAALPNTKIAEFTWNGQNYLDCRPDHELYQSYLYNIVSVMLTFGLPLAIQLFCYVSIIRCLLSKDTVAASQACRRHNRDMRRVIRMLVAVVIVFLSCWLPIKILMVLITYSPTWLVIDNAESSNVYAAAFFVCHWMASSNSFVNPIIYSFMSKSFRVDFRDLLSKVCKKGARKAGVRDDSVSTSLQKRHLHFDRPSQARDLRRESQNSFSLGSNTHESCTMKISGTSAGVVGGSSGLANTVLIRLIEQGDHVQIVDTTQIEDVANGGDCTHDSYSSAPNSAKL